MNLAVTPVSRALNVTARVAPRAAGRAAFYLFCNPLRRARVRPGDQAQHERAVTETLQAASGAVAAYRWGDGDRPVILMHGFGGRASQFSAMITGLESRGYTALAFDAPGHGHSKGRGATIIDYAALMRELQDRYGHFHAIVTHSFGVMGAFHGLRNGVTADRLVTISGMCDFTYLTEGFCNLLQLGPALEQELRRRTEEFFAPETNIWERFSASYRPGDIAMPMLVIHDEDDDHVDVEQGRRLAAAYGDQARLLVTEGLGHRKVLGDERIVASVLDFVDGERDAGGTAPLAEGAGDEAT